MDQKPHDIPVVELKDMPSDKKIGQLLIEAKVITSEQLAEAIALQKKMNAEGARKFKVGEILLFQKIVSLPQLHEGLRKQKNKAEMTIISTVESKRKLEAKMSKIQRFRRSQIKKKPTSAWTVLMDLIRGKKPPTPGS